MIEEHSSLVDVAFSVCTALDRDGMTAVLTGGSAATFYAPDAYQSEDADFVLSFDARAADVLRVMRDLGYRSEGGTFRHACNRFTVEFPPGPLAVGRERIETFATLRENGRVLHVLSAQDSVRDRLCSFFYFRDETALDAAVAIARAERDAVDLRALEDWVRQEEAFESGYLEVRAFSEFVRRLDG